MSLSKLERSRKEAGLCIICSAKRPARLARLCGRCQKQHTDRTRKYREERAAKGVCSDCPNPVKPDCTRCTGCLNRNRTRRDGRWAYTLELLAFCVKELDRHNAGDTTPVPAEKMRELYKAVRRNESA